MPLVPAFKLLWFQADVSDFAATPVRPVQLGSIQDDEGTTLLALIRLTPGLKEDGLDQHLPVPW